MNDKICYISYEDVLKVYRKMIDASDGGFAGVRDEGGILATLDFVQSDIYYPTFAEKLCYLVFQFCSGHYFNDGNKRIALTLGAYFLHQNHCPWEACIFMRQFEAIVYQVLLLRIMAAFVAREDYDEALKIDIANAMSRGKLGFSSEDDNSEDVLIR